MFQLAKHLGVFGYTPEAASDTFTFSPSKLLQLRAAQICPES